MYLFLPSSLYYAIFTSIQPQASQLDPTFPSSSVAITASDLSSTLNLDFLFPTTPPGGENTCPDAEITSAFTTDGLGDLSSSPSSSPTAGTYLTITTVTPETTTATEESTMSPTSTQTESQIPVSTSPPTLFLYLEEDRPKAVSCPSVDESDTSPTGTSDLAQTTPTPSFPPTMLLYLEKDRPVPCPPSEDVEDLQQEEPEPPSPPALGNLTHCPLLELLFAPSLHEPSGHLGTLGSSLYSSLLSTIPPHYLPNPTLDPTDLISAFAVNYTTTTPSTTPEPNFLAKLFQPASSQLTKSGAAQMAQRLASWEQILPTCKDTKFILGGSSLGAAVMRDVVLTPTQRERVVGVVTFGYPYLLRPREDAKAFPVEMGKVWSKCVRGDRGCQEGNIGSMFSWKEENGGVDGNGNEDGDRVGGYGKYVPHAAEFVWRMMEEEEEWSG